MPKRGSVQLLLLPFRPRVMRWLGVGAVAIVLLIVGVVQLRERLPLLAEAGLTQALRQSAWEQALAGQTQAERWPWEDVSANMSPMPMAKVPRLGLSAAVLDRAKNVSESASVEPRQPAQAKADKDTALLGDVAISDVAIGDSITFTAADGATCVYRITGRRVVDPHLANGEAQRVDGGTSPFTCSPLGRLIMQATQAKPPVAPRPAGAQQKL
jgi:hypothetical protein